MSGFTSPNWTMIPNDLMDVWMPQMDACELKVVLAVLRLTVGYHRADVRISLRQICRLTGLSKASVLKGARAAETHSLILRLCSGAGKTSWTPNIADYVKQSRLWAAWCDDQGNLPPGLSHALHPPPQPPPAGGLDSRPPRSIF